MSREHEVIKGIRAEQLLDDPLLQEALTAIEEQYVEAWKNSKADDTAGREQTYFAMQGLNAFRDQLRVIIGSGKLSARQLEREKGSSGN